MAAKQVGKKNGRPLKKGRPMKTRRTQKKHPMARQKQKLPARKLKKPRTLLGHKARQIPKAKMVKNEKLEMCSTRLFVSQMLRQMPKVRMAAKARGLVKTLLTDLYSYVASEIKTLSQNNELSSISLIDIQTFLKEAMKRELEKHAADNSSTTATTADANSSTSSNSAPNATAPNASPTATA